MVALKRQLKNKYRKLDVLRSLIAKAHKLFLPIDIVIQLYDQLVLPILLYGSEFGDLVIFLLLR